MRALYFVITTTLTVLLLNGELIASLNKLVESLPRAMNSQIVHANHWRVPAKTSATRHITYTMPISLYHFS